MERNEAIEIVKKNWANDGFTRLREALETLIPELAESEDESIRKTLVKFFIDWGKTRSLCWGISIPVILAWLEKQGKLVAYYEDKLDRCACENFNKGYKKALEKQDEQKLIVWNKEDEQNLNVCLSYIPDEYLRRWLKDVIHIKYDKPADNIGPKFNVGDWVVSPNGVYWHIDAIRNGRYQVSADSGEIADWSLDTNIYHKFTLQDAKGGDILFQDLIGGKTFIYNGVNPDMAILYSFIISNDGEDVLPYHIGEPNTGIGNIEENKNIIYPATKEQRDLLFQRMHEAGYEWDADKKELKKIEQKPADRVERKFEIGDLITNGALVGKIDEIYEYCGEFYYHAWFGYYYADVYDAENWHKWTINDAKEGDVLAAHECYVIFKEIDGMNIKCYCTYHYMGFHPSFYVDTLQNKTAFYPATKEQRDLLFKKMQEAGYEWDAEKKELKKIKQNPAWSKEDKQKMDRIYSILRQAADTHAFSTSCRLIGDKECIELQDFLKSLKDRHTWLPSDEQIDALIWQVNNTYKGSWQYKATKELLEQLKKIKVE